MKYLNFLIALTGLLLFPLLASGQHTMTMDSESKSLKATETYHAESLHQIPTGWTNQDGKTIRLADFRGNPLIVVMFYGRCTGTCPVLIQRAWTLYSEIDEEVRDRVQVLAVSFDTENDTPAALKAYAEYEQLDIPGWNFVTAKHSDVRELAMLLGVQYRQRNDGHYEHSNLITALDAEGRIAVRSEGITGGLSEAAADIEALAKKDLQ